ncbi:MAG: hypothetical protein HETSPECPRED_007865 [Heterodermia speciosa]|uniref:Uncharacterized protein n=1 Tax=Heterodermia speciosa TaxID=116794 RepID=A0A8H3FYA9_9LECA|nr:MAG: hypothetical protein HETSPECPRED_007865 [Heterodermia speciosa]
MAPASTNSTGSPRSESKSLICQPDRGFSRQGQFDWFGLARSTVNWSVGVLARLSAAGVDQYTAVVAQNLCLLFRLGPLGRGNMHNALIELPCFRSVSDAIWFGFGTRHLLRDLAKTEQGTLCIGICATLSSCYSEIIAAEVLAEVVSVSKAPVELTPSILEWKNLIHGLNGALHMSIFPRHAERLINLCPGIQPFEYRSSLHGSGPACSSPSSIATALLGIGDVTRGAVEAITIIGGPDAGWLAAVCEWLFGLRIRVNSDNGDVLYTNELPRLDGSNPNDKIQVLFIYRKDRERSGLENNEPSTLQCLERVYHLETPTELFQVSTGRYVNSLNSMPRVSGRLSWETALSQTFRPEFEALIGMESVMGRAVGAAARVLTALVQNEDGILNHIWHEKRRETYERWPRHSEASHGRGFVSNLIGWFPELHSVQRIMEETTRETYCDAKSIYETQHSLIRNSCLCDYCKDDFPPEGKGTGFCKVVILETIIYLGQMLSSVGADRRLGLQRHGVEGIYTSILGFRLGIDNPRTTHKINGVLDVCIYYSGVDHLQQDVHQLFTGETIESRSKLFTASAYSQAGICTYFNVLCDLSDAKESINLIHVTPGRIEFHGCPYDVIQDGEPQPMGTRSTYHFNHYRPATDRIPDLERRLKYLTSYETPEMRVKQRIGSLESWYGTSSTLAGKAPVIMQPGELAEALATSRGFIHCPGHGSCPIASPKSALPEAGKSLTIEQLGKVVHIIRGDSIARCLAANGTQCMYEVLRRHKECIQCCMKAALVSPRERVIIVSD